MRDYAQDISERKIDHRAVIGYASEYAPEEGENAEHDESVGRMFNSERRENIVSALTEPEDWERGYN